MNKGPTHSNRSFKFMRDVTIKANTEVIIEEWDGSNYDKERQSRTEVPGAKDVKMYLRDPSKEYSKGDAVMFFRLFENSGSTGQAPAYQSQSAPEPKQDAGVDDEIPF